MRQQRVSIPPIQGSAADICKLAMLALEKELEQRKMKTQMLLQIHHELLFEAPDAEVDTAIEIVRRHIVRPCALKVPLKVDIGAGRSWADAH